MLVFTKVVIRVKLSGLCPGGIPPCKKHFTMPELAAGQNIWIKLNRKSSSNLGFGNILGHYLARKKIHFSTGYV